MRRILISLLFATTGLTATVAQAANQSLLYGAPSSEQDHEKLLTHTIFSVMYDLDKHDPVWVAEYLTKEEVDSEAVSREGFSFEGDPLVEGEAKDSDYKGSGYDRGHMAPAEDMELNTTLMRECFYMTNMLPQKHALNGGRWKQMEELARDVAVKSGQAWIFSGPIFRNPNPGECSGSIGKVDKIAVPQAFFKIIVFRQGDELRSIDFIIPHLTGPASVYKPLSAYLTSIDEVETETGLDFLNKVPSEAQSQVEATIAAPSELNAY